MKKITQIAAIVIAVLMIVYGTIKVVSLYNGLVRQMEVNQQNTQAIVNYINQSIQANQSK